MSAPATNWERTSEELRILQAAADGRLRRGEIGRYLIDGESNPDRRTRERLMSRGWIEHAFFFPGTVRIRPEGLAFLRALGGAA